MPLPFHGLVDVGDALALSRKIGAHERRKRTGGARRQFLSALMGGEAIGGD
jgi:hypothetical protein